MSDKSPLASSLNGKTIALPESRQLDILADLFERRGAAVIRTPLVTILDSPERETIERWLQDFIRNTPDYFIILTGEGLRRLCGFARRADCLDDFVAALSRTCKICRGPKPGRALREIGLEPDLLGKTPTTPGIIESLEELDLSQRRVAIQLYGEEPNLLLQNYLQQRQVSFNVVAPYVYAPQSDVARVMDLIERLRAGAIDVIAFTSQPQFLRLQQVAREHQCEAILLRALRATLVAAVGPVVAEQLQGHDIPVAIMPGESFFMKPMVREIEKHLEAAAVVH